MTLWNSPLGFSMMHNLSSRQQGGLLLHWSLAEHVPDWIEQQERRHQVRMLLWRWPRLGAELWGLSLPWHCGLQEALPSWPRIHIQWSRYFSWNDLLHNAKLMINYKLSFCVFEHCNVLNVLDISWNFLRFLMLNIVLWEEGAQPKALDDEASIPSWQILALCPGCLTRTEMGICTLIWVCCRHTLRAICVHEGKVMFDLWRLINDQLQLFPSTYSLFIA